MKRPFKKLTAWLCCMAMLISFIPATALPVFADEAEGEVEWTVIEVTQTEGELPALEDPNSSYELVSDLTLTGDLTVPTYIGVDQVVTLDLAGHNLIAGETADGGIFAVDDAAGHLTITDSVGGGKLISGTSSGTPAVQIQAGTFTLEDGEITGWTREGGHGGMIFVAGGATFNMEGGKLTYATSAHGPAIRTGGADAVINMSDGEISNCTATSTAPIFLHTDSTFNMTGGTITGNNGVTGGAICLYSAGAEANIGGGTISSNKASGNGGAICANYGVVTVSGDAAITGNEATGASSYGGAIFLAKNTTANIKGGTISGNKAYRGGAITSVETGSSNVTVNISGGIIENNIATNRGANLYGYDATYNISGGTIGAATVNDAEATGNLNSELRGAETNISGGTIATICTSKGTDYTKLTITGNPVIADLQNSSTNTASTIGALTEGADITYSVIGGLTIADGTVKQVGKNFTYQKPTVPTSGTVAAGEYVLTGDHVLTSGLTIAAGTEVTIDLAGNTISMPDKDAVYFSIAAGGKLTIKDSVGGGKVQFKETTAGHPGISISGTFVLEGGELNGWKRASAGGAVYMYANSTFIMTGGLITGCDANSDSVIRSAGGGQTVTITGGSITGNDTGARIIGVTTPTAGAGATITIGGDANISGNTLNGEAITKEEVFASYTHVTVGGEAVVGSLYTLASDEVEGVEGFPYGSISITGAPTVGNITMNSSGRTPLTIKNLTEGASITTALTLDGSQIDSTVAKTETGYTWQDPATVVYTVTVGDVENGTVAVDPTEGVIGTTVTVTAEADEGYELTAILVDGEAIDGTTFDITGNHVVTATFTEIVADTGLPTSGTVAAGEYVLDGNLTLTGTLAIVDETVIDLAGHTITAAEGGLAFNLTKDVSKLTLKDSVGGGKVQSGASTGNPAVYLQAAGAEFTLDGGEITGWNRAGGAGGMVYLLAGTTFTMNGGKLTGASCASNAIIRTGAGESTITINGGEISGNSVTGNAPIGLASGVTMTIIDGTFTGNSAGSYAGLIQVASGATLNISGGTFTKNSAVTGGGVIYNEGNVSITGGTFTGNEVTGTASGNQGGVIQILKGSTTTINGGTFTGNSAYRGGAIGTGENVVAEGRPVLNIGGTASISGNSGVTHGANIYAYTTNVTISGGTIGTAVLNGADAGKNYGNIYLRGNSTTNLESTLTITGGNLHGIRADNYTASVSGNPVIGEIQNLNSTVTMSNLTSGANIRTAGVDMVTADDDTVYTTNDRDFYFKGDMGLADKFVPGATVTLEKDDTVGGGISLTAAGEYTLDLAGYTLTGNAAPYFTIGEGVKLTIIDSSAEQTGKIVGLTDANDAAMIEVNGEFVLNGGTLTGHTTTVAWAAVKLNTGSVMTMNGGEISGNTAYRGAGVSTGDVAKSNVTFTMSGGVIKDNATTNSYGSNIYLFQPAMATFEKEAVIGASYNVVEGEKILATSPGHNAIVRGGSATITGGTYKLLSLSNAGGAIKDEDGVVITPAEEATGVVAAISGNPVIELLSASGTIYATIGELTTGASIATDTTNPLNVLDNTVNVQGRLYQCSADLTKILIIGNSFGGDTINYLAKLGKFYGKGIDAANMYIGSQNFRWHAMSLAESLREEDLNGDGTIGDSRYAKYDGYNDEGSYQEGLYTVNGYSKPATFLDVLGGDKQWDYVVLQNGVEYVGFEGTYNSDVQFLIDYIKAAQPQAQIYFNQTWATDNSTTTGTNYMAQFGGDQAAMYNAILANTDKFFAGDDARFAKDVKGYFPIGTAIQEMRGAYDATPMTRDGYHLSLNAGRMIAGLTVMKTLFDVDLDQLTAADVAAMFDKEVGEVTDSSNDAFDPTEENVAKLIAAVETACGYAADGTVAEYDEAAAGANKQFNPDAVMNGSDEYVAVYENVTEVGQAPAFGDGILMDSYATAGAGKIVIYKNGTAVGAIDELWLEANAGIVLTDRYEKIMDKAEYYIMADAQAPQLAVVNRELYMTFTVMLYTDDGQIINGGIYLTTSTDGVNWTCVDKVSDAPMAYGLTALADETLMMSVTDTATKVLKLTTAGDVTNTVELADAGIADVAFAEANDNVYALTSNGALYVSDDQGKTWIATSVANGVTASPDMVTIQDASDRGYAMYVTWADEANLDIYGKIWTIDVADTETYGWNKGEATVVAEYAATAYNNKSTGGQPTTIVTNVGTNDVDLETIYAHGGGIQSIERSVITVFKHNLTLGSNLGFNVFLPLAETDALGVIAKSTLYDVDGTATPAEHVISELPIQSGMRKLSVTLTARQMGDRIETAIYDADGNQLSIVDMYAMTTYLDLLLANNAAGSTVKEQESRTLVVDMLNYGAAAQTYLDYNTDRLVNAHLTEEQQSWATPEQDLSTYGETKPTAVAKTGTNMSLKTTVELNVMYATAQIPSEARVTAGDGTEHIYARVTYINHVGALADPQEVTIKEIELVEHNSTYSRVKVDTLTTPDAFTEITCELLDADKNPIAGTAYVTSIAAYANKSLANDSTSDLANLTKKLMSFGVSSYNYLH